MQHMQRRIAVLLGSVSLLLAAAPAAYATTIPFDVHVPINPQGVEIGVGTNNDTGLVGVCDAELRCTGFRVTEATSPFTGGTSAGQVTLRGDICVMDTSASCSTNGIPFTGVKIRERVVDSPEAYLDPFFVHVNVCVWVMSPQDIPYGCNLPVLMDDGTEMDDTGNLAEAVTFGT